MQYDSIWIAPKSIRDVYLRYYMGDTIITEKTLTLSGLDINDVFEYKGKRGIVKEKSKHDDNVGSTTIIWDGGKIDKVWWDQDNWEVRYLGKGKQVNKIELD